MIDSLRFVERKDYSGFGGGDVMIGEDGKWEQPYRLVKILQYTDGYNWFDVHCVKDEKADGQ